MYLLLKCFGVDQCTILFVTDICTLKPGNVFQFNATSPGSSSNSIHELGLGIPSRTLSSPAVGCPPTLHKLAQVGGTADVADVYSLSLEVGACQM